MSTAPAAITLDLNRIEELFQAPDADPFSPNEAAVLGQSGMDFLRKRFTRRWPNRRAARQLLIRLPSGLQTSGLQTPDQAAAEQLARTTRAAIQRYCDLQMQAIHEARRLQMGEARRELLIALAVTIIAVALLAWCAANELAGFRGYVFGVVTLFAAYAAALAIWDALESLFFDWTPFAVETLAYQWLSGLEVRIVAQPAHDSPQPANSSGPRP